jgi:hypothetical protein
LVKERFSKTINYFSPNGRWAAKLKTDGSGFAIGKQIKECHINQRQLRNRLINGMYCLPCLSG